MAFMLCKKMGGMGLHDEPAATINKWGDLTLNRAAQALAGLDTAMYVRFFFDRDRRLLAIEAADKQLEAAIRIVNRKHRGVYQIKALLKPFRVDINEIVGHYRVTREQEHNLTIVNLNT